MNRAKQLIASSPLLSGSILMLAGSNIANIIAYVYHPILGRILGNAAYGELAAFISLVGFLSSLYSFLGLLIVKYSAKHKTEEDSQNEFFALFSLFNKPALVLSAILLLLTPILAAKLQLSTLTYVLVSPVFYLSFRIFFYKAYLQGKLSFGKISIFSIFEVTGRLVFALILIALGFSVPGAAFGFLVSLIIEWYLLQRSIRKTKNKKINIEVKGLLRDGLPVLTTTIATTAFFSMDVLLVRTFFSVSDAGTFAAAAVLGKIILFATAPITAVLFPLISKKHAQGESGLTMFLASFTMTFLFGGAFALVFYFFPSLTVLPFGTGFTASIPLLFPYSIFIFLFSLCLVIVNYYLPREKYFPVKSLAVGAVLQVIAILAFHEYTVTVIYASIVVTLVLLIDLLLYFLYENRKLRHVFTKVISSYTRL